MSDWQDIVQQRPKDVDEVLPCMRRALDYFHARNDYRAVFLRAYYIITLEVHAAVHQLGDYKERIIVARRVFWQRVIWFFGRLLRKRRFGRIEIEEICGMAAVPGKTAARLKESVQPF